MTGTFDLEGNDPDGVLVARESLSASDLTEVNALMAAMADLRAAEDSLTEASQKFMKLGRTDMRAIHYLIVAQNTGTPETPGTLAKHLGISSASTTKLLDRLEAAGHIERHPHPHDRRALIITVTDATRTAAYATVGAKQAKRAVAAARLTSAERATVTAFLTNLADELRVEDDEWP